MEQGGAGRWSDAELHGALARVFGYTAFRPHQIEIVKGILGGHDSLSIMPTGGGKSLCFQLPSHLMDGVCVVELISSSFREREPIRRVDARLVASSQSMFPPEMTAVPSEITAFTLGTLTNFSS